MPNLSGLRPVIDSIYTSPKLLTRKTTGLETPRGSPSKTNALARSRKPTKVSGAQFLKNPREILFRPRSAPTTSCAHFREVTRSQTRPRGIFPARIRRTVSLSPARQECQFNPEATSIPLQLRNRNQHHETIHPSPRSAVVALSDPGTWATDWP